jgi:hypothetical protein
MSSLIGGELYNSIIINPILATPGLYVAAISMLFPTTPCTDTDTCTMTLDIKPDAATEFARAGFDVPLRTDSAGNRCLKYSHGASSVMASEQFLLQGCNLDFVYKSFKDEMMQAIVTNPVYYDERQQCQKTTNCITMTIPRRADEKAVIYVSMNLLNGTRIKDKLFPQYRFSSLIN